MSQPPGRRPKPGAVPATIRDVARIGKVSIATVSRALNSSPLVSEETRRRVLAAASQLGYWPNGIARSLITNRTQTLGLLLPDLHGEFFSGVIHGVDLKGRELGFHTLISRSSARIEDLGPAIRSMRGRVDGLILMTPDVDDTEAVRQAFGEVPTVLLGPHEHFKECDTLSIANVAGAREVVRHLIGLGHTRLALVGGPDHNVDALQRREGFRAALRDAGIAFAPELESVGDFSEISGYEATLDLLRRTPRPTAIFAANDYMAVGVMGALEDAGLRVPEDVAVVGFDDIPLARYLTPPLTTVHVDMLALGQRAVELLTAREPLGERKESLHELFPTTLVVRGSCGTQHTDEGKAPRRWNRSRPLGRSGA